MEKIWRLAKKIWAVVPTRSILGAMIYRIGLCSLSWSSIATGRYWPKAALHSIVTERLVLVKADVRQG